MPHSKKHSDTFRHPQALESLKILNSIDIWKVRELHGKKANTIVAEFNIHKQELRNRASNPWAVEKYLPTLQVFQKRVEALINGTVPPPHSQADMNTGFRHVTQDELVGVRIADSRAGSSMPQHIPRTYVRGWTAENMISNKKTR